MTFNFDCPWCGDSLDATVDASIVRCATCSVTVDLADPTPALSVLAIAIPIGPVAAAA